MVLLVLDAVEVTYITVLSVAVVDPAVPEFLLLAYLLLQASMFSSILRNLEIPMKTKEIFGLLLQCKKAQARFRMLMTVIQTSTVYQSIE